MAGLLGFAAVKQLKGHLAKVKAQEAARGASLQSAMKADALKAALGQAQACGLDKAESSTSSTKLLPQGPSASKGLDGQADSLFKKLLQALDSTDAGAVRSAARVALIANLGSDAWTAAAGPVLFKLCELWRE